MPRGDLIVFLIISSLALALAEMSVRQEASGRWVILAIIWVILVSLLIWTAYG